ncbi:hypothetical protein BN988_02386 [Oceanobacillus picturae]|uniref:DUF1835 domain-containing protein n=1 Tax=Oceanobacillus picturae TaxID=171693 RepID=W9AMG5_9BACI|nr:DUF1835 domain-containing protein [Oceanobacillus picturae]CDO03856.1 hypothetical protein BN988_02386 [Oceanobacillus picturae]
MNKDLKRNIDKLTEEEVRSVLLQTLVRLEMVQESNESPSLLLDDLHNWHNRILQFAQNKGREFDREYNSVHIVCGESSAGSLKVGLEQENKVIGFPDFLAVGPIQKLHKESWARV